ncbi:MAG: FMN-binding protein [Candidatus Paceibacterota bacterium]
MKKYVLSFLVVASFVVYVLYSRDIFVGLFKEDDEEEQIVKIPEPVIATPTPVIVKKPPVVVKPTPIPIPTPIVVTPPVQMPMMNPPMMGQYKDGSYTGNSVYNYHGYIQVQAIISGGKISDVVFLDYPNSGDSRSINRRAMPKLTQEAIVAQSSKVNTISGATDTSGAFRTSLESALVLARN